MQKYRAYVQNMTSWEWRVSSRSDASDIVMGPNYIPRSPCYLVITFLKKMLEENFSFPKHLLG